MFSNCPQTLKNPNDNVSNLNRKSVTSGPFTETVWFAHVRQMVFYTFN